MRRSLFALCLALAPLLTALPAEAQKRERVGKIGGFDGYTRQCVWTCHPRIKRARAQICYNNRGARKIVYWESMSVPCRRTEEGG